jgi:hypothetical protein
VAAASSLPLHKFYNAAFIFAYMALLRISNIAPPSMASFDPMRHLRWGDIVLHSHHLVINLRWTKTLQRYRQQAKIKLFVCSFDSNNNVGTQGYIPCIYVGSDYSVSSFSNDNYLVQLDDVNSFNFNLNRFGNGNVSFDYIDLDHVISCQVIDCQICSFIRGSFITFIHNSLGFIPHS